MFYVMTDIHGCHTEMMQALTHWKPKSETLVVLGDLIDRGPDSFAVIATLIELKAKYPDRVVILKGNHDDMFAQWITSTPLDELGYYYMITHNETIQSFYGQDKSSIKKYKNASRNQRGSHMVYNFKDEVRFLADLPLYHETDNCIFVHAGINLDLEDWRGDTRAMNTIRNRFVYSSTKAPKTVFFGHTPTSLIRDNKDNSVWMNELGDKIGLDGGVSMGGQLNAVKVDASGAITETFIFESVNV